MLYPKLKFPKVLKRPFFYTNFVATLDGKVAVDKDGYWPIGSKKDYQTLLELRSHADCLIHGGTLGKLYGDQTLESISKESFSKLRKNHGKDEKLPYYVMTNKPGKLVNFANKITIFSGDLKSLVKELNAKGYKNVLVEGGPTLLGSFLKEELIDEVFLTIAPKIYGSKIPFTKTLVEGVLLPSNKFKLKLISVKIVQDELFLRYNLRT